MARDINRINPFLQKVGDYWRKAPDYRFGQLMVNVFGYAEKDPFFLEEDEFLEVMDTYFDLAKRKKADERIAEKQKEREEYMEKNHKKMAIRSVLRAFNLPEDEDRVKRIETKLESLSERQKGEKK